MWRRFGTREATSINAKYKTTGEIIGYAGLWVVDNSDTGGSVKRNVGRPRNKKEAMPQLALPCDANRDLYDSIF